MLQHSLLMASTGASTAPNVIYIENRMVYGGASGLRALARSAAPFSFYIEDIPQNRTAFPIGDAMRP